MLKIGVMVSGGGTNLQAIIDSIENNHLDNCKIVAVVSSKSNAYAMERARKHNIPAVCIARKQFDNVEQYENALIEHLQKNEVELVVLAGFMSILGEKFINNYKNRIINVHPSLIPSFCGMGYYGIIPHEKALEYGVKVTGATVHFVELEADEGPIILQKAVYIKEDDTPEILQRRVMEEAEWNILPLAIKLYADGKLSVEGRRVKIIK